MFEVKRTLLISVLLFRLLEVPISVVEGFTLDAVAVCDLTTSVLLSMLFEVCRSNVEGPFVMYENCFTSAVLVSILLEITEVTRRGFTLDMVLLDSVVNNFVIDIIDSVRRLEVDFTGVVLMMVVDTDKVFGSGAGKYIIQCK